jgi:hypothetical protein
MIKKEGAGAGKVGVEGEAEVGVEVAETRRSDRASF